MLQIQQCPYYWRYGRVFRNSGRELKISAGRRWNQTPAVQKDGTEKVTCLIIPCDVRPFKLWRHLQSVHSKLSEIAVDKAVIMSRIMENNKQSIDENIQTKATIKTN